MAEINLSALLAQAQAVTPTAGQWFVEVPAPPDDPFAPKAGARPWVGQPLPTSIKISPGPWLSGAYADLLKRLEQGFALAGQPGLDEQKKASYDRRLEQLAWQINLLQLVIYGLVPRPVWPAWLTPDLRDKHLYDMRQIHAAGRLAITLTTPGGRTFKLVPWRSDPPAPGELDPKDMVAVIRLAALAGTDELTLLDRLQLTT